MPDITMCCNNDCPFRDKCYRYRAIPAEFWQSYGEFKPFLHDSGLWDCLHFWEIGGRVVLNVEDVDKRMEAWVRDKKKETK